MFVNKYSQFNSHSQKGFALLTSVIVVSVMLLTSFTLATIFIREMRGASVYEDSVIALKAADSGIELATKKLETIEIGEEGVLGNCSNGISCQFNISPIGSGEISGDFLVSNISQTPNGDSYGQEIQLDSQNNLHVVWYDDTPGNFDIYYSKWDGTEWESVNLSNNGGRSDSPEIEIDSKDNIHVIWEDKSPGNWDILYNKWTPETGWLTEPINISNNPGDSFDTSLRIDSKDNIHVVWRDETDVDVERYPWNDDVFYAKWSPETGWTDPVNICRTPDASRWPKIRLDSEDYPHVVWQDYSDDFESMWSYDIYYTKWTPETGWLPFVNISYNTGISYNPEMGIDSEDNVHIVWQDDLDIPSNRFEILYKKWSPITGWSEAVNLSSTPTENSLYPEIEIDSKNNLHVIWREDENSISGCNTLHMTFYTKWTPEDGWLPATNISGSFNKAGDYRQIRIDSQDNPHVVWYNTISDGNDETPCWSDPRDILYNKWTPETGWLTEPINISNNSGDSRYVLIRIDSSDGPHIVWRDNTISEDNPLGKYEIYYARIQEYLITATGVFGDTKRKIEMKVRKNIDSKITILSRREVAPD